ncbi:GntR family transcriptional regulator [Notoacmeibacter marinus]|uniref:GntR family transcriptional regulator n=1 Tax=Notoacmeibacter marinus TaxID=1876515 RepID=UPI000DF3B26C|nr:GntR family transcriptional regulator [Notoacmeibacter marinus]
MNLTDSAYIALRDEILTGRIPGDTLWSDREIAQRMNLSRTPVREAIQRLAADGLVEVKPRRGTRVLPLRTDDVREIHQIAKALELEAALLLANREDRDLRAVEKAVDDMDAALKREDRDEWVEADTRFHREIVDNCGNRRLAELYHSHRSLTDRARYFSLHLRPLPIRSAEEHRAMYDALVARDTALLSQLYHDHWNRTTQELLDLVRRHANVMPVKASSREETK